MQRGVAFIKRLLTDWDMFHVLASCILAVEAILSSLIILKIKYTEIDWIAYMQEVEGWVVEGHTDYRELKGDTGPLVYPAGFMYIFAALRWITGGGKGQHAIFIAQWFFLAVYLVTQAVTLNIYGRARVGQPYYALLLIVSKRVHSLYVLRLFNDCVESLFAYASVLAATKHKWLLSSLLLACALSIKMNALLYLPGLLFLLVRNVGVARTVGYTSLIVLFQLIVGVPFWIPYPESYFGRAYEFSRVFFYQWTVNLKFLDEATFTSATVARTLVICHLLGLVGIAALRWCSPDGVLASLQHVGLLPRLTTTDQTVEVTTASTSSTGTSDVAAAGTRLRGSVGKPGINSDSASTSGEDVAASRWELASWIHPSAVDAPALIAFVLFSSNFVGIAFSRTLHYQFYSWYFHTLPFLLAAVPRVPLLAKLVILGGIEYAFNVGDASGAGTPLSSAILQVAHMALFAALLFDASPIQGSSTRADTFAPLAKKMK